MEAKLRLVSNGLYAVMCRGKFPFIVRWPWLSETRPALHDVPFIQRNARKCLNRSDLQSTLLVLDVFNIVVIDVRGRGRGLFYGLP
jgi:hypothetical protein